MKKIRYGILAIILSLATLLAGFGNNIITKAESNVDFNSIKHDNGIDKEILASTEAKQWKNTDNKNYSFPIDSTSSEWIKFTSHDEMLEACAIPNDLLTQLSTSELIDLVLDYPLLGDIQAYNSYQQGLEAVSRDFNGLKELLTREDAAKMLLQRYCNTVVREATSLSENDLMELDEILKYADTKPEETVQRMSDKLSGKLSESISEDYQSVLDLELMEMCLSQEEILNNLSEDQKVKLITESEKKYIKKSNSKLYKGTANCFYKALIENNQLDKIGCKNIETTTTNTTSYNMVYTATSGYVLTPKGTQVYYTQYGDSTTEEKINAYNWMAANYPNATIVSGPTSNYNCHSYAWYSTSSSNTYWIPNCSAYVTDGSYAYIGTYPTAHYQHAVWKNGSSYDHSAICISYYTKEMISKWGSLPLVRHAYNYSPYSGTIYYYQ